MPNQKKENKTVQKILNEKKPYAESKKTKEEQEVEIQNGDEKLSELNKKAEELAEAVLRLKAENENIRKRHDRDMEKSINFANANFAKDLMEVMENFHRAVDNISKLEAEGKMGEVLANFVKGIELTKVSLEGVFSKHQIERVYPMGEKFDHHFHQAVKQESKDGVERGTVLEVIQAGYILKDRVLRPAIVVVAS